MWLIVSGQTLDADNWAAFIALNVYLFPVALGGGGCLTLHDEYSELVKCHFVLHKGSWIA